MGWFDSIFTKKKKPTVVIPEDTDALTPLRLGRSDKDHLGLAAQARRAAQTAIKERRFDDAWGLLHVQKEHYMHHASNHRFPSRDALALDGSVHEDLANIRRLEKNYDDALVHMLYCVASSKKPSKAQSAKLATYFQRCAFPGVSFDAVDAVTSACAASPSFRAVQIAVATWRNSA